MPARASTPSTQLRQQLRRQRRALSPEQQLEHARQLVSHILHHPRFMGCKRIACYLANDGEINPLYVMQQAWLRRKRVYLPVLSPLKDSLLFAPFEPDSPMLHNQFGILEPACHPDEWVLARHIDLVLVPLVAFDELGNRMGMGGGFYDRSLAHLSHRQHLRKPYLIGLAHELQKTDHIDAQRWDIPLDAIATEEHLYKVKQLIVKR